MAGLLAGAVEGASKAGLQYTGAVISEQMQARRDERLAGIRRGEKMEERTHQKGLLEEQRSYAESQAEAERERAAKSSEAEFARQKEMETHKTQEGIRKAKELEKAGLSRDEDPAEIKTARTLSKELGIPFKEAWDISQRTKADPRKVSVELFSKRRQDPMTDETEEESWMFVRRAMKAAGFESPSVQYKTREEVRDAYRSGNLTREEARKLISEM